MLRIPFPMQMDDGSVRVASRFKLDRPEALEVSQQRLREWIVERRVHFEADLIGEPQLELLTDQTLQIVFHGKSGSRRWKDWMVAATQELAAVDGLTFHSFFDLVSGHVHPGSLGAA